MSLSYTMCHFIISNNSMFCKCFNKLFTKFPKSFIMQLKYTNQQRYILCYSLKNYAWLWRR